MNVVIIGCGRIAQERHAPECIANPDVTISGFYDINSARAQKMCEQYGGKVYHSFSEICEDKAVDFVIICSANSYHASMCIDALLAKKNVLCEKPMAITYEEAVKVAEVVKTSSTQFMVAHNQRFDNANIKAKALLDSGLLGNVLTFTAQFSHGGPEFWSIDAKDSIYYKKNMNGFGVLGDLAVHKVDLLRWMLGTECKSVSAQCVTLDKKDEKGQLFPIEDNAIILMEMQQGQIGTVEVSWTNYTGCNSSFIIHCENGSMSVSDSSNSGGAKIEIRLKNGDAQYFEFHKSNSSGVVDAFVTSVMKGEASPVGVLEGVLGMQILHAALDSSEQGRRIEIEPFYLA